MNGINTFFIEPVLIIMDMIICMIYYDMLFGKRKQSISTVVWLISYIIMEIPLVLNTVVLEFVSVSTLTSIIFLLSSILGLFFVSLLYHATWKQRIFAIMTFQVIAGASEICGYYLLNLFVHVILKHDIITDSINILFISKLLLCLMVFIVGLIFHHDKTLITFQYSINLLYMPIICSIIIEALLGLGLETGTTNFIILSTLISTGLISMCLVNYYLLNIQLQNQELKELNYLLEQQNALQQMKYDQSVAAYKESRRTIHDSKKHLLYVRECAMKADDQIILDYVNQNLEEFENSRNPINTGNLAIDALIGNCVLQARDMDIDVTTNIQINVMELPLPDYDLSIILGNLTDNAMAAIKSMDYSKVPHLTIELFMTKEQFVCHFINSTAEKEKGVYDPELAFKNNTLSKHGYGLLNVSRIVHKYYGFTHFEQKDEEYESTVIIPLIHNEE